MGYVFPNCVAVVNWSGQRMHLNPNQQWRDDDPFVQARPEFFESDPVRVSTTEEPPVETATRAPGERRAAAPRRTASKKPATGE